MSIEVAALGQSGFRLQFENTVVYVDPYLSDHVEELEGVQMRRMREPPLRPSEVHDADWVLTTHVHADHTDPATLIPMASASPGARFMGPTEALGLLEHCGIRSERMLGATEQWRQLAAPLKVCAVPAAHPSIERGADGSLRCVGYLFDFEGRRFYHAGDTSVDAELIAAIKRFGPIDVAFLPVNERNFQRDQAGILGNMTVREAFHLGIEIGARVVVPMHWDMFAPNCVFPEEIELLYERLRPPFTLAIRPTSL